MIRVDGIYVLCPEQEKEIPEQVKLKIKKKRKEHIKSILWKTTTNH